MFGRKRTTEVVTVTRIELSDESREALGKLDEDLQTLNELTREVTASLSTLVTELNAEVATAVKDGEKKAKARNGDKWRLPEKMREDPGMEKRSTLPADQDRIRETPFTRAPRSKQVEWLQEVMADQKWYSAIGLGREYANDERHFRYLRSALGNRMREMHEDGLVERRGSKTKGSMFEYRLL